MKRIKDITDGIVPCPELIGNMTFRAVPCHHAVDSLSVGIQKAVGEQDQYSLGLAAD